MQLYLNFIGQGPDTSGDTDSKSILLYTVAEQTGEDPWGSLKFTLLQECFERMKCNFPKALEKYCLQGRENKKKRKAIEKKAEIIL